jgi:hypothetical protein
VIVAHFKFLIFNSIVRFPEVGGGSGLNLGKDRVKGMVEAFGGKVTGAVSGRTHILVVGKEPGMGKVTQAEIQPNCQLMVRFVRVCDCVCSIMSNLTPFLLVS